MNSDLAATYAALILADEGLEITVRISQHQHKDATHGNHAIDSSSSSSSSSSSNNNGRSSKGADGHAKQHRWDAPTEVDWKGADKGSLVAFGLGRMASHCGSKHASPRVAPAKHQHSTSALPVASGTLRYDADRSNTGDHLYRHDPGCHPPKAASSTAWSCHVRHGNTLHWSSASTHPLDQILALMHIGRSQ
ncbi:hypothetical protein L1887_48444 [Cichorium endivia]|nr:hypothetical protein L1887_48444 [Cichorium endivia]